MVQLLQSEFRKISYTNKISQKMNFLGLLFYDKD